MDTSNNFILEMSVNDLDSIKPILETEFDDFWNFSILKSELENANSNYFVLKSEGEILGFAGILIVLGEAEITNIVVRKNCRGNGLSKLLLQYLVDYCSHNNISKIHLEVNASNLVAINLYKLFGFKKVGLRKNYYKNNDALLLAKDLINI